MSGTLEQSSECIGHRLPRSVDCGAASWPRKSARDVLRDDCSKPASDLGKQSASLKIWTIWLRDYAELITFRRGRCIASYLIFLAFREMESNLKNSKTDIVFGTFAAVALLDRAVRGIFLAEASSLVRGNRTPRLFVGEAANLMGLIYLGLSFLPIGYLLRFNRWRTLLYIGLFVFWLIVCGAVVWL